MTRWTLFSQSPLNGCLKKHLTSVGIEKASPIQLELINTIMTRDGKRIKTNVLGCSPTGTGKTLAYVLPILHFLTQDIKPYYALILAPTRELAYQIYDIVKVFTGGKDSSSIKTLLLVGGGDIQKSETDMQGLWSGKPNIVVATPGKMVDQLALGQGNTLKFDFLVLDEADLLISSTFANQLKDIMATIDERRQTLVLSATLTSALERLQKIFDKDAVKPVTINFLPKEANITIANNPNLDQRYLLCPEGMKPAYLVQTLSDISFKQVIIFCSSARKASLLHKLMVSLGFDDTDIKCHPVLLIGGKEQKHRLAALEKFKSLKSRIMVATAGLVGRGLDLPQVDLVIQYNCPTSPVDYIHQVGRTCRKIDFSRFEGLEPIRADLKICKRDTMSKAASRFYGRSILFVSSKRDAVLLREIEEEIKTKLKKEDEVDVNNISEILKPVAIALKDAELAMIEEQKMLNEKRKR